MTEDDEFNLIEIRLKRKQQEKEVADQLSRANVAAAEFIASQSAELLAITTLRKAFEYGYRTGWRDAKEQK
jgi:GAF domain-containing protein